MLQHLVCYGNKILATPAMSEGYEDEKNADIVLLQVDENDRWNLRFFDCGMINFLISPEALLQLDFDHVYLCLNSL